MKVGDIIEVNGKKKRITFVSGNNYSYCDCEEKIENPEVKPEEAQPEEVQEPVVTRKRSRRK